MDDDIIYGTFGKPRVPTSEVGTGPDYHKPLNPVQIGGDYIPPIILFETNNPVVNDVTAKVLERISQVRGTIGEKVVNR